MDIDELLQAFHRELIAEIKIPQVRIAEAYQISRQGFAQLINRHTLTREIIENPCLLLEFLLTHSNASPLRTRLLDADFRLQVGIRIDEIHFEIYQKREARILKKYEPKIKQHALPPLTVGSIASAITSPDSH